MYVWVVLKCIYDPLTGQYVHMQTVEYCKTEEEARKDTRLFELQTPVDLKGCIKFINYNTYLE